jgi:hypothetical protein
MIMMMMMMIRRLKIRVFASPLIFLYIFLPPHFQTGRDDVCFHNVDDLSTPARDLSLSSSIIYIYFAYYYVTFFFCLSVCFCLALMSVKGKLWLRSVNR